MKGMEIIFFLVLLMFVPLGHSTTIDCTSYWKYAYNEASTEQEPTLPEGLDLNPPDSEEPMLPQGLEESIGSNTTFTKEKRKLPFDFKGFLELRVGTRTQKDPYEKDISIGETRSQLEISKDWENIAIKMTGDLVYDHVYNHHNIHLENGLGWLDLREANLSISPFSFLDLKIGRQILTWGTGDMVFLNDLFPKDWKSFFIGRDEEYLKAPSDVIKGSFFTTIVNIDVIYAPRFDPDRFIDGKRISYWNENLKRRAGRGFPVKTILPDRWLKDCEYYIRLFKNLSGYELSLYYYHGFWKSPAGMNYDQRYLFPSLNVYGASIRGDVLKGIGWMEIAYYYSLDDKDGDDPFIQNSQFRLLVGYEQEVAKDFTVEFQYYLEETLNYNNYIKSLLKTASYNEFHKDRHLLTLRLTKFLMQQNLKLGIFVYYSPSDNDGYIRPNINYKVSDSLMLETGANLFWGEDPYTFFGQFEKNSNIYFAIRYNFIVE